MPALIYLRIDHPHGAIPRMKTPQKGLNRRRPHFIADFLIRSIIRIWLFNEYPGIKHETPPQNRSAAGFADVSKQLKSLFQADFGYKKAHRNFDRNQLRWAAFTDCTTIGKSIWLCYARQTGSYRFLCALYLTDSTMLTDAVMTFANTALHQIMI